MGVASRPVQIGDDPDTSDAGRSGHVLRQAPVRNLVVATGLGSGALMLQAAALSKQVYDISGREIDLALLGLAEFLPAALLVLVTGSIADRFDRKRVATLALFGELLCALAMATYALSDPTSTAPLFLVAIAFGACRAFNAPATRAMPPMVARRGELPRVVAMASATMTTAMIVGPAASGLLYAIDPSVAYIAGAALLAASVVALQRVRFVNAQALPDPEQRPTVHAALEGLRFIRRTPLLLAAISLDLFAVLFGGAVALIPVVAEERLGVGDVAYGFLRAAPGIGAAVMAAFLALRPVRRHVGRKLLTVVAVFGVGTIVFGWTRSYAVAFVALMVLSAADMVSVFIRMSMVPLLTPDDKRGRVLAVENVFIGASNELGAFESGAAAQAVGAPVAIVGGGLATIAIVGVYATVFPALRRLDRFDDLEEPGPRAPSPPSPAPPVSSPAADPAL